mgnify:CR=1 FL=1
MARSLIAISVLLLGLCQTVPADSTTSLKQLLNQKEAPEGVVFEIITEDDDGLEWAIPRTQQYIKQLHEKFPQLAIAVVTHGREMFSLQKRDAYGAREVHEQVQSLVQDQNVALHACGTYAGWFGVDPGDFPEYVDVAAAGPAQINDYRALGYVLITLP